MEWFKSIIISLVLCINFLYAINTNSAAQTSACPQKFLLADKAWADGNRDTLNAFLCRYGNQSPGYDKQHPPVAAFDWDNTIMKNDMGEALLYWMLLAGKILRPANYQEMNPWLSTAAIRQLEQKCSGKSKFLPTKNNDGCVDTILAIYHSQKLENGQSPWKPVANPERIYPPYFFYAQLLAGYTPQEIADFTEKALALNLAHEIGAQQKIGSQYYPAYVRIYEPMKELISALQKNGFDVRVISASLQPSIEVAAKLVGLDKSHIIGIRQTLNEKGQLSTRFQACGIYPDGNDAIISYRLGKRCWLNQIVFKMSGLSALKTPTPIQFGAGDSEGDLVFLSDARALRLVINRHRPELLIPAQKNSDNKWLLNPMFIE